MAQDDKSLVPADPSRQFERMTDFDTVSRVALDAKLHSTKLESLLTRICKWIADTQVQEQGFLAEAAHLLKVEYQSTTTIISEDSPPSDTPTEETPTEDS